MPSYTHYTPFRVTPSYGYQYDLRLTLDGITANIIKNTIVSLDGTDNAEIADSIFAKLAKLGFRLPE
jgi:hypothetical protein